MSLPRRSGVALWRQVQMNLEQQLADGVLQPGDQLPTEARLSSHFGVNRHTVRRALSGMEERGLIRVEQGRGTFVQEPVVPYHVSVRTRFTDNLAGQNRVPARTVLEVETVEAEAAAAAALEVAAETALIRVVLVGDSDGRRISHSEHLFPAGRFPGLDRALAAEASVTRALAKLGVPDYKRKWTRVTARMPSGREADLLQQPRSRPILLAESVNVDPDGRPIEFGLTRFNSDWVQIVFEP
jgi:GntR family phosphonate transport system transcriptional regulator